MNKPHINMNKNIIEWKWTKGENYERTKRIIITPVEDITYNTIVENTAYLNSLNQGDNNWEPQNQNSWENEKIESSNLREDTDKKLAERQMMAQISLNPYLTNNDYANDISISDSFLKPMMFNKKI